MKSALGMTTRDITFADHNSPDFSARTGKDGVKTPPFSIGGEKFRSGNMLERIKLFRYLP